jgi:predicted dienelactone hydrolase
MHRTAATLLVRITPHGMNIMTLHTWVGALFLYGCSQEGPPPETDSELPPSSTRYVARGAHAAGFAVFDELKAWYPADATGPGEIEYSFPLKLAGFPAEPVTVLGAAHRDAAVDAAGGPYPLVVLSHGFGMNPEWYHTLAEHLSTHGFVVLGPEHLESDWFTDVVTSTVSRPADIRDSIDLALAGPLSHAIDAERIAVIGHSYGGYTALAAAGASFDLQGLQARCEGVADPFVAAYFCEPFVGAGAELAELMDLDAEPEGLWPSLADDRVDAIVSMAGDAYLFGEAGLEAVQIPTMSLGGTADTGTPWDWGAGLTFEAISSHDRALVSLEGAEHFVPVTSCEDMPWTASLPPEYASYICEDPAWDKQEALDTVHHFTTAFLLHTLAADPLAYAVLDPALYAGGDPRLGYTVHRSN